MYRPVPRNIDRPNRLAEYIVVALFVYYPTMFLTKNPMIALPAAITSVYILYKMTLNKPEGAVFRYWYRYMPLGKFVPTPRRVKRFEV